MKDSIVNLLDDQALWERFLAYRLVKGRFDWKDFVAADDYVATESYRDLASHLMQGERLGIPRKKMVNKRGTDKKRVVYTFAPETMQMLSYIAYLLYRYDDRFTPNCYAFRRGVRPQDAIRQLNKALSERPMWAYKVDIHNYFNSIPIDLLMPMLAELLADDLPLYHFLDQMLTDDRVVFNDQVIEEQHGVMAGTPTSPFLANVFLDAVDRHFYEAGVVYARYSDDIILFAPDRDSLEVYKAQLLGFLKQYRLEVNPDKERIYAPDEPFEFLGFKCHGHAVDISKATVDKMKGKIRRRARSLMRWRKRKGIDAERAMALMIRHFNHKFFDDDDPDTLTWSRWYFPVVNRTEGMKEIDRYLQQQIRYLSTGKHSKVNYRVDYATLKRLGYRSLVNAFYQSQK